jgi:uncharacterized protein (DUF885 family)
MPSFAELTDAFLHEEYEDSPVRASSLGLTDYDERLDDLSESAITDAWPATPTGSSSSARSVTKASPSTRRSTATWRSPFSAGGTILADWQSWRREPLVYTSPIMGSLFTLFLHRLRPNADLVDAAVSRLEQIPTTLAEGTRNLDPALAPRLFVERGLASARGGTRYLRELLPMEAETESDRDRLRAAGDIAADALDAWSGHLESLVEQASGNWVFGEERYTRLLRERESLPHDARSLRDLGRAEFDRLDREMREVARDAAGTDDWRAALDEGNADHPRDGRRDAPDLRRLDRARALIPRRARLITLPAGESCAVAPSPHFMRPVLGVAFYIAPPAVSDSMAGHYFVPYAPDGAPPKRSRSGSPRTHTAASRAPRFTRPTRATTGTWWSKVEPAADRHVLGTPYFVEGWALYAERMMREQGFFTDPMPGCYQYEATIFRAARIVVDTSLHLGEMGFDEAVEFMTDHTAMPSPRRAPRSGATAPGRPRRPPT